ncbi:hypothetical protein IWW57_001424 [Coemansia sp. S610]|uniref:Uncharacterized protein n=1 Tax=Coemansia linderi TaxID=2663919 RepID=A0ACC1KJ91_9FUNG|nr:hypothetical protein LPJ60_004356 [Coemansia sp. RSA 2675]KAJ2029934.1 hypothetical protein IWW57_001424 [Coemansia sp. S610]KAJ2790650.1 hypothetical protein GGI18_001662 [Coemansia linderi]
MPTPLDVVAYQSRKGNLSEVEQQALKSAEARQFRYKIIGGALGCGAGYLFTRRSTSKPLKAFMLLFNGALGYNVSTSVASLTALREMSNEKKYPHIVAAMRDLRAEILRSSGVDPEHPEAPRRVMTPHKVDIRNLPPPMTAEEKAMHVNEGMVFDREIGDDQAHNEEQYSFGNPGLQQAIEVNPQSISPRTANSAEAPSTWDSIRKASDSSESAWSKVRRQNTSQQQPRRGQQQDPKQSSEGDALANTWDRLNQQDSGEGSFTSESDGWASRASTLSSDEFPRSREDFEEATRHTTTKYGDSVYT